MFSVVALVIVLGTVVYLGYPVLRRDRSYAPDQADDQQDESKNHHL